MPTLCTQEELREMSNAKLIRRHHQDVFMSCLDYSDKTNLSQNIVLIEKELRRRLDEGAKAIKELKQLKKGLREITQLFRQKSNHPM